MRFIIADTFTKSLGTLDPMIQNLIKQSTFDFQTNPQQPGQRFHRLDGVKDKNFWSFRVNSDVRIIVSKQGPDFVLCYADHHDKAYQWAKQRRLEVHPETGAAQMIEIKEVVEEVVQQVIKKVEHEPPLFERFEPDYLLALGVPVEWLDAVRYVGQEGLIQLIDHLPQEAVESLIRLAEGQPVPRPVVTRLADPFSHPDARRRFRIINQDQELLRRALESPWERWIVFLHPSQQDLVDKTFSGPARVSGGAGTGKTVVALHRAAALAARHPDARILLTTFSKTLAARLQRNLSLLLSDGQEASRIEVMNLHSLAAQLWGELGGHFTPLTERTLRKTLQTATEQTAITEFSSDFLMGEWELIEGAGVRDFTAYRTLSRSGRGIPIGARQRLAIWQIFEVAQAVLQQDGLMTFERLCSDLATRLEARSEYPYAHVVADETQDFGPAELRLLRALAPFGNNDVFLAGDIGQRIYRAKSSFLASGIDIRGRSAVLRLNYRTTEEIRRQADALLPGVLEDADGEKEERRTVSLLSGPEPEVLGFADFNDEAQQLAKKLDYCLRSGFTPGDIAIFARTRALLERRAETVVSQLGLTPKYLSDEILPSGDYVSLGTMHQAKGLEFKVVVVLGCEEGIVPLESLSLLMASADNAQRRDREEAERNLLYVACTRARERLLVSYVGELSHFFNGI